MNKGRDMKNQGSAFNLLQAFGLAALACLLLAAPLAVCAHDPLMCTAPCCEEKAGCCDKSETSCAKHPVCDYCISVFPDSTTVSVTSLAGVFRRGTADSRYIMKFQPPLHTGIVFFPRGWIRSAGPPAAAPNRPFHLASTVLRC
jgi:hypothetical protein